MALCSASLAKRLVFVLIGVVLHGPPLINATESTDLYVDLSFTCPAKTTCPQVCSPTLADCPEDLKCNRDLNETLCADGSCAQFCDPTLVSPCAETSKCSPITCGSIDTYYDVCVEEYGGWYEFAASDYCSSYVDNDGAMEESWNLSWSDPAYVFVYCWVGVMSIVIVHWCWFK